MRDDLFLRGHRHQPDVVRRVAGLGTQNIEAIGLGIHHPVVGVRPIKQLQ